MAADLLDCVAVKGEEASEHTARRLPCVLYAMVMDPSQKFGSMEEQVALLARFFKVEGSLFLPLFICADSVTRPTPLEQAGVPIACLDMGRFRWSILFQLLALIRRNKIAVVHWNFSPPLSNSYLWWLTLLRPRIKHYFTDHNSRTFPLSSPATGLKRWCKRILLKRYARTLCVSQFVFECLDAQKAWSNLVCCKHFINTDRFRPNPLARSKIRAELQIKNGFVLLAVANLITDKGIDVILHALKLLPEDVVLWVNGAGPEADQLRGLTRDLCLTHRVVFHGPKQFVEPFMQAADCFVCPSLWAEAAGLVNIEAQASGLPVIASDVGGIPEYVADGRTGFLFPRGDAGQLADRVRRLMSDEALRQRFSEAARAFVEEHFSPTARLPGMLEHYRSGEQ